MPTKTVRKITIKSKKLTHQVGTFFQQGDNGSLYILAQVDRGVAKLIGIDGGNRYKDEPANDFELEQHGFKKVEVVIN